MSPCLPKKDIMRSPASPNKVDHFLLRRTRLSCPSLYFLNDWRYYRFFSCFVQTWIHIEKDQKDFLVKLSNYEIIVTNLVLRSVLTNLTCFQKIWFRSQYGIRGEVLKFYCFLNLNLTKLNFPGIWRALVIARVAHKGKPYFLYYFKPDFWSKN